jgi:O-antigen/teichoic acid export membrane protein
MPLTGPKPLTDPKASLLKGALWAVGTRWSVKAVGLVSTVILARFLKPEDYGIVMMAFLVVGLVEAFLNTGAGAALVRLGNTTTVNQINSAWTLRGIQGCLMAVVLMALAPFAADYFREPRITNVLLIAAAFEALMGFSNIGMTLAYRDLKFSLEFKLSLYTKLCSVAATWLTAMYFGDYRALVSGIVAGFIAEWFLSYKLHPYRPKWCTKNIGELWAISKWLLATAMAGFFLRKTDQLIAGRIGNTHQYGLYTVGGDIGQLAAGELGPSLTRPLFPILASMKDDWERAKAATIKTLGSVNSITMPLGFGLAAVSDHATLILLGNQWSEAVPFVAGFAIIGVVQYLTSPLSTMLNVAGYVRIQTRIVWVEFAAFVALALLLTTTYHLQGLMWARIGSSVLQAFLMMLAAQHYGQLPMQKTFAVLIRPLCGSALMYGLLVTWGGWNMLPIAELIVSTIAGGIFFVAWLLITWHLVGRPEGLESNVIEFFQAKLNQIKAKKNGSEYK